MNAELERLLEPGNEAPLETYLRVLHNADIASLIQELPSSQWLKITHHLSTEDLGEVLVELDEDRRHQLGNLLTPDRLVAAVEELESDDAADVLGDLESDKSREVFQRLDDEDEAELRELLAYDEESAGGLMQTEVCRVQYNATVADAIEAVRDIRDEVDNVLEVYVVDDMGRLVGTLELADLVLSQDSTSVDSLRKPIDVEVTADVDQEEVALLFRKYDVATLPVIDSEGVLLGRITFDDVHDVLEEEASEDILAMAGTSSNEDVVYGDKVLKIVSFRLPWFISSLLGALFTQRMSLNFVHVSNDIALVLAVFVPVVNAMSGSLGSQTAMIVTRGLAIGRIQLDRVAVSISRELKVGFLIAATIASTVGIYAHFSYQQSFLGATLLTAMMSSMSVATIVGVLGPISFKRIGVDPAIAAGPLITTSCDVLGVLIYVSVAFLMLS